MKKPLPLTELAGRGITANLSPAARAYLTTLGIKDPDADADTAALLWVHALAIGYAPAYLAENADGIRQDWPRIPLPASKAALLASAELGRQVAALLDTETPVLGVTTGKFAPGAEAPSPNCIAAARQIFASPPAGAMPGKEGVTMPGKGKMLTRGYRPEEQPENARLGPAGQDPRTTFTSMTPLAGATCRRRSGTSPSAATR